MAGTETLSALNSASEEAERAQRAERPRPVVLLLLKWCTTIGLAFALDRPLAIALRDSEIAEIVRQSGALKEIAKAPGYFLFTLIVSIALCVWHPLRWRAGAFELLCALVGGTNAVIKWLVGRTRPFKLPLRPDEGHPFFLSPMNGGLHGLFHQANDLSFVSGHAALSFAMAAGVSVLFPRGSDERPLAYFAYGLAIVVLIERVAENAHWLSDTVCGAALGVWGVALLQRICRPWLRRDKL